MKQQWKTCDCTLRKCHLLQTLSRCSTCNAFAVPKFNFDMYVIVISAGQLFFFFKKSFQIPKPRLQLILTTVCPHPNSAANYIFSLTDVKSKYTELDHLTSCKWSSKMQICPGIHRSPVTLVCTTLPHH